MIGRASVGKPPSVTATTAGDVRKQVVALVEGALASGETPHPRNARLLERV